MARVSALQARGTTIHKGAGKNRVLLLATNYILAQAEQVDEIFTDGTFKSCPRPFYQLYFVRGRLRGQETPRLIAAGLLPGADEKNNYDVLHAQLHAATGGRLNPKAIMTDFEKGIGNSARKVWPQIVVSVPLLVCAHFYNSAHTVLVSPASKWLSSAAT